MAVISNNQKYCRQKWPYLNDENHSWPVQLATHSQTSQHQGDRWWFCWHPSLHARCYHLQYKCTKSGLLITQRRGSVATADRTGAHPCRILANKAARKTCRQKKWWKRGKRAEREIRTKCVCSMSAFGNQFYSENIAVMFNKYFFI